MFKKLFGMKGNGACTLNCLIKSNQDGEKAYRQGAEIVKDSDIRSRFIHNAEMRARNADELAVEVRKLGAEPATGGTLLGKILIPLKVAWIRMLGGETSRLVSAAESGEDCARSAYAKALKEELPIDARKIVEHQMEAIQQAHDTMRALEKKFQPVADRSLPAGQP